MRRVWAALILVLGLGAVAMPTAQPARVLFIGDDGVQSWFEVEIADDENARRRGLMYRDYLAPRHGMWFDFGAAQPIAMWMKNTLIPLDMVFLDADAVVIAVRADTTPLSLEHISVQRAVRYVLEINAGEAARYDLNPGDRVLLLRY